MADKKAFRASILHCLDDPGEHADSSAVEYFADGLLLVEDGIIVALGEAKEMVPRLADDIEYIDHSGKLILPGFIDCHVHFPQIDIIASYGEQLLDWLVRYAYPAEEAFADAEHANAVAEFFVDELLRNGTTTALVFPTVHPESVHAIFNAICRVVN
jgi:guanine deaminase